MSLIRCTVFVFLIACTPTRITKGPQPQAASAPESDKAAPVTSDSGSGNREKEKQPPAQAQSASRTLDVEGDFEKFGMHFPEKVDDFLRGRVTDYGSPALGHSVGYKHAAGITVTAYIYGTGGDVAQEMAKTKAEMLAHPKNESLEFHLDEVVTLHNGERSAKGRMALATLRDLGTQAFVFSRDRHYIKFRITAPMEVFVKQMDSIKAFLEHLYLPG